MKVEVRMKYQKVRLDQLNFSSTPVRHRRSEQFMEQLEASLEATGGPAQPLILRDLGGTEYIIVAGESRAKALSNLGYPPDYRVPALVGQFDDAAALEYGLVENYVRAPLSAYEEALVVRALVEYYGKSQKELAKKLGKSQQHLCRLLALFELVEEVGQLLHEGAISLAHAAELVPLKDAPHLQRRVLEELLEQGLNVKATRVRVRELLGDGAGWIIEPGEVWVSKDARVSVYPSGKGYKVDFSFSTTEEFDRIVTVLRNRLSAKEE
jgi:ParB family chromosome partitioning protein